MRRAFAVGFSGLALAAVPFSDAIAAHRHLTHCAQPEEVTAIAATSIQQELMVAALTCNEITHFNQFQTDFGPELRASDRTLMHMFKRLYGGRGEAEYHAFKTRLANNSEMRSIHGNQDFCSAASLVFAAALASAKPALGDFVSGVQVSDPSPVDSCQMTVTASLNGAMAIPAIVPRPKPAEFEDLTLVMPAPSAETPLNAPAAPVLVPTPAPATSASAPKPTEEKKKGILGGIFD